VGEIYSNRAKNKIKSFIFSFEVQPIFDQRSKILFQKKGKKNGDAKLWHPHFGIVLCVANVRINWLITVTFPLKYVNKTRLFAGSSMKHFNKVLLENRVKSTKSSTGLKFAK